MDLEKCNLFQLVSSWNIVCNEIKKNHVRFLLLLYLSPEHTIISRDFVHIYDYRIDVERSINDVLNMKDLDIHEFKILHIVPVNSQIGKMEIRLLRLQLIEEKNTSIGNRCYHLTEKGKKIIQTILRLCGLFLF